MLDLGFVGNNVRKIAQWDDGQLVKHHDRTCHGQGILVNRLGIELVIIGACSSFYGIIFDLPEISYSIC